MKQILFILFLFSCFSCQGQKHFISVSYDTKIQVKQIFNWDLQEWSTHNLFRSNWEQGNLARYFDFQRFGLNVDFHLKTQKNNYLYFGVGYHRETFSFSLLTVSTPNPPPGYPSGQRYIYTYGMKHIDFNIGISSIKDRVKTKRFFEGYLTSIFLLKDFFNSTEDIKIRNKFSDIAISIRLGYLVPLKNNHSLSLFTGMRFPYLTLGKNIRDEQVTAFTLSLGVGYAFGWDKKKLE